MCAPPHQQNLDPPLGTVADVMRRTRAFYLYTIRLVRRNEQHLIRRFAQAVLNGNNRDLWSEVRRLISTRSVPSRAIDGQTRSDNIANIFAEKYNNLYNSVSYDARDMEDITFFNK